MDLFSPFASTSDFSVGPRMLAFSAVLRTPKVDGEKALVDAREEIRAATVSFMVAVMLCDG